MKRLLLAGLVIVAFSTASFSGEFVAGGKTHTVLGDYKIELADKPVVMNGKEYNAFVIRYQNSPYEVKVVITDGRKCKNYIVLSEKLSVKYVCNKNYFGVEKLDKTMEPAGYSNSDDCLNRSEYFHQKVLSSGRRGEIENTQMIAAYFPMLIKDEILSVL